MHFYHASQAADLKELTPHVSEHGEPLVYFSQKRENVLVYLSNAVEKYCREIGFPHTGPYQKWGSYGFSRDGILVLDEYYPGATAETYRGAAGYIYTAVQLENPQQLDGIPFAVVTGSPAAVEQCEYVPDAYEALLDAARKGLLIMRSYEETGAEMREWVRRSVCREYRQSADHPEYRQFLKAKFGGLLTNGE